MKKLKSPKDLNLYRRQILKSYDPKRVKISVCGGTGCSAFGGQRLQRAFTNEIKKKNLQKKIEATKTGCHGFCEKGPVVVIFPQEIFYQQVKTEDVAEIILKTAVKGKVIERLLYTDPATSKKITYDYDVPFYKKQEKIVFRLNGIIDPTQIDQYIFHDGYVALSKTLSSMKPEGVITEVEKSGLRGRGGAGFPAGKKWKLCQAVSSDEKYLICNADEGDPGAFMDRSVLEGNPHVVIEGMLISAYAIGASKGYVYVRAEYPLAVKNLKVALAQAKKLGLLGKNILGKGFDFDIEVKEGAGAFVCGEETALIASIEGKRGMPRTRPPFPADSGLWGKPTIINNVETLANVAPIILNGAKWFNKLGTKGSKGTKIFALTGKVNNTGLVEVSMGTKLREIVFDIGGGIPKGKKFKAVQIGGPSGGCLPAAHLDSPIDYASLTEAGAIMGSGGLVVMDEDTCMVDIARYFLSFAQSESCGKCVPCRIGTKRMLEILTRLTKGEGKKGDIENLLELGRMVKDSALCGLGQTAPNPVLTTIKYFRNEYKAHIKDKKCPAGACKELTTYIIKEKSCTGCKACVKHCPVGAISGKLKEPHKINKERCIKCGICIEKCEFDAIYRI